MSDRPAVVEVLPGPPRMLSADAGLEREVWARNRRRKRIFLVVVLLSAAASMTYNFMRPAVYQSRATLLIQPDGADAAPAGAPQPVAVERQIMLSEPVVSEVLERLTALALIEPGLAYSDFRRMLSAVAVPETAFVELRAEGQAPEILAAVVNAWTDVYLARQAKSEATTSQDTNAALREQVSGLEEKVAAKRAELERFRAEHDIDSAEREENRAAARMKGLVDALNRATETEIEAESRLMAIRAAIAQGRPVVSKEEQRTLENLESRAADLRGQMAEYEAQYTAAYMEIDPKIRSTAEKLRRLEERIEGERQSIVATSLSDAEQELESARRSTAGVRAQIAEFKQTAAQFNARFAEHEALDAELTRLEELHRDAQEQLVHVEVVAPTRPPRITVMESAVSPDAPIRPPYARDALIGLASSLLLGFVAVMVYEFFNRPAPAPPAPGPATFVYSGWPSPTLAAPAPHLQLPEADPVAALESPRTRELSPLEVRAMLGAANAPARALIGAILSGLDVVEAARLRWADVLFERGVLSLSGRGARDLGMAPALERALVEIAPATPAPEAPVWVTEEGAPLTPAELDRLARESARAAGIPEAAKASSEALRHTYVAYLVRQGARLADVARITGPIADDSAYELIAPPGAGQALAELNLIYPELRSE